MIHDHDHYVDGTRTLRNLPKFDDCADLLPSNFDIQQILKEEVYKLVAFVKDESPPLFSSAGCLSSTDERNFDLLSGLADQVFYNLNILKHDNARTVAEHCEQPPSNLWSSLTRTRSIITSVYGHDETKIEGRLPKQLQNGEDNFQTYCRLVDYVLAVIAWWIPRCIFSVFLQNQAMAILAMWAVKLKVIARDPTRAAELSLANTSSLISTRKTESKWKRDFFELKAGEGTIELQVVDNSSTLTAIYFEEKWELRTQLFQLVHNVLNDLWRIERSPNNVDCFEICALVYETGLDSVTTLLMSGRDGDVQTSSSLRTISFCHNIYNLLWKNSHSVQGALEPPSSQRQCPKVRLEWADGAMSGHHKHSVMDFYSIDHLVSMLVPLSLMGPDSAEYVSQLLDVATLQSTVDERVAIYEPPKKGLTLEYIITTQAWQDRVERLKKDNFFDPEVCQLSQSPLRQRGLSRTQQDLAVAATPSTFWFKQRGARKWMSDQDPTDYRAALREMRSWHVAPTHIKVNCQVYVASIITVAIVLVLGGLAIPFTVGGRIKDVDPFQITLFAWIVSGFILVFAKSRYVGTWPWHDFLKGNVVCKSLSDLSDVAHLDPQIILRYLLENEYKTWLVTSGPYNGMFDRRCDSRYKDERFHVAQTDGFSIDKPVALRTMVAAGFVILKVAGSDGENLICLDGRKGAFSRDAANKGRRADWMTCRNFNTDLLEDTRNMDGNEKEPKHQVLFLQRLKFQWERVLGIYIKESLFG